MQRKINLLKNQTPILRNTNKEQFSRAVVLQDVSLTDDRQSIIAINLLLRNFKLSKQSNNINIKPIAQMWFALKIVPLCVHQMSAACE